MDEYMEYIYTHGEHKGTSAPPEPHSQTTNHVAAAQYIKNTDKVKRFPFHSTENQYGQDMRYAI